MVRLITITSLILISLSFCPAFAESQEQELTIQSMNEIIGIAKAIGAVQPRLEEAKYIEYALGIYRASKRFDIRPAVLIAITHQESSFRESMPEGKAGEIGITQVLKRWLSHPQFRAEFKNATIRSMKKPSNSFLYSAWILAELKKREKPGTLPYWSFYNAREFNNRIKYFIRVTKHMVRMKKNLERIETVLATTLNPRDSQRKLSSAKLSSDGKTDRIYLAKMKKSSGKPMTETGIAQRQPVKSPNRNKLSEPQARLLKSAFIGSGT